MGTKTFFYLNFIGATILEWLAFYLLGSFIAFDLNPTHWWLITSWFGRILWLIFAIILWSFTKSEARRSANKFMVDKSNQKITKQKTDN